MVNDRYRLNGKSKAMGRSLPPDPPEEPEERPHR